MPTVSKHNTFHANQNLLLTLKGSKSVLRNKDQDTLLYFFHAHYWPVLAKTYAEDHTEEERTRGQPTIPPDPSLPNSADNSAHSLWPHVAHTLPLAPPFLQPFSKQPYAFSRGAQLESAEPLSLSLIISSPLGSPQCPPQISPSVI